MHSLTTAPAQPNFATVPAKWRVEVDAWRKVIEQLDRCEMTKSEAMSTLNVSLATLNRKLAAVAEAKKKGTPVWMALVPRYSNCGHTTLPKAFVDYWKSLQEQYQRKSAPAMRELFRRWKDRHPIPGYAGHPGHPELPAGWNPRTLYRYQPTKLELTALRHGIGRAQMLHAPKVYSTRVGMHHLQFLTADDVWLDMKGHLLTSRQLVRPLQIGFMDVASACRFKWGNKPQMLKEAKAGKVGIEEGDMRFLFAGQLLETGLSRRGTTHLLEHGTATLRDRVIDVMNRYFGEHGVLCPGAWRIEKSGMLGQVQAICGMSDGKGGKGNPFFKAWLESLHNLMHNELAALPGQVGHDRDAPEHFGVIEREAEQLFRLADRLQPEFAAMLKLPTLEYHTQLVPAVNHVLDQINKRTEHTIEGWEKCGWLLRHYRMTPDSLEWKNDAELLALPAPVRAAYLHMAELDARCFQPRKLSPHEVFTMRHRAAQQAGELVEVPPFVIAEILYDDLAQPKKVGSSEPGMFTITDSTIAPGEMLFESRITTPEGREEELRDGETYEVVLNPFDTRHLYVFSATRARGSFLGLAPRYDRITRGDRAQAERAWGRSEKRFASALEDTRRRHAGSTQAAADRKAHNAGVIEKNRDFQRQATALLNASTYADNNNNNNTDETDHEPQW